MRRHAQPATSWSSTIRSLICDARTHRACACGWGLDWMGLGHLASAVLVLMLGSLAWAEPLSNALVNTARCAGLQSSPVVTRWAELFTRRVAESISNGSTSPASGAGMSGAAIDSTQSEVGPIIEDHATTIGSGNINVNMIASRAPLTKYDGMDLSNLHGPGKIILQKADAIVASALTYDIDTRVS